MRPVPSASRHDTVPCAGIVARTLGLFVLLAAAALPASAESLRCQGQITTLGDSKLLVLQRCGEPMLKDSFCKPVEAVVPGYRYPFVLPPQATPCLVIDEWMYDRGPGNLLATVRFQNGVVDAIRYEGRNR